MMQGLSNAVCLSPQAKWVARLLSGRASLPSRTEMLADTQAFYKELQQAGVRVLDTHNQVGLLFCRAVQHVWPKAQAPTGVRGHFAVAARQGDMAALLEWTRLPVACTDLLGLVKVCL